MYVDKTTIHSTDMSLSSLINMLENDATLVWNGFKITIYSLIKTNGIFGCLWKQKQFQIAQETKTNLLGTKTDNDPKFDSHSDLLCK